MVAGLDTEAGGAPRPKKEKLSLCRLELTTRRLDIRLHNDCADVGLITEIDTVKAMERSMK